MIDGSLTYLEEASALPSLYDFVNPDVVSLISTVSILILLLLSEGNILLGLIS